MIYIVVHRDKRNDIMSAIMRDAGMASKAKSICFTLPVSATAACGSSKRTEPPHTIKRGWKAAWLSNLFILSAVSCVRGGPYP